MAVPSIPTNLIVQQGNRQVAVSCDITAGATGYVVARSVDGVTFSNIAAPSTPNYIDASVTVATAYWYQMAASNGSGNGAFTAAQKVIPAPNGELSLYELRLRSQQRADRVGSNFVITSEWNYFLDQALYELYDLLMTVYEDYFEAPEISFTVNGTDYLYPLPDGQLQFQDLNGNNIVAPPFYKCLGLDLALNTANNAYVTMNKYNLIDRNKFIYPNSASTIYGVFNMQYRVMGTNIRFIPTPSAGQKIRLLYAPRLPTLLQDTDCSTIGYSGWLQYVIVRAAKYALDKEESDTTKLDAELLFMKKRIEDSAVNRDAGQPDSISNIRQGMGGGWGDGRNGVIGGF